MHCYGGLLRWIGTKCRQADPTSRTKTNIDDTGFIEVFVQTQSGKHKRTVFVDPKASTCQWMPAIAAAFSLNFKPEIAERIELLYDGVPLHEGSMASEYDIPERALTLVMKPCAKDVPSAENQIPDEASTAFASDAASSSSAEHMPVTTRPAKKKCKQRRQRAAARAAAGAPAQQIEVADSFTVIVQSQRGQEKSVDVKAGASVEDLLMSVEQVSSLSFSLMNLALSFNGKRLTEGSVSEYGICDGSVLNIVKLVSV